MRSKHTVGHHGRFLPYPFVAERKPHRTAPRNQSHSEQALWTGGVPLRPLGIFGGLGVDKGIAGSSDTTEGMAVNDLRFIYTHSLEFIIKDVCPILLSQSFRHSSSIFWLVTTALHGCSIILYSLQWDEIVAPVIDNHCYTPLVHARRMGKRIIRGSEYRYNWRHTLLLYKCGDTCRWLWLLYFPV